MMQPGNVDVHDHRVGHNDPYVGRIEQRFGPVRHRHSVARIVAARRLGDDRVLRGRRLLANEAPGDVSALGDQPDGFGFQVDWNVDDDMAIVAFVNSSSVEGLRVTGIRDGDTFQLDTATGIATYAVDTENEGIPGLISVVAVGADVVAGLYGQEELIPLINAAQTYAQQRFPERQEHAKPRNPFGVGEDGGLARAEGGVIICAPAAHQLYNSGSDSDAGRRRWIQGDGHRIPENYPDHIAAGTAFFLRSDAPVETLHGTGSMVLGAWDGANAFPDNFGFYEVSFVLRRGRPRDTNTPVGVERPPVDRNRRTPNQPTRTQGR
jgi:hypothetical protein